MKELNYFSVIFFAVCLASPKNPLIVYVSFRAAIPGHFQRAFTRLLNSAEFEELSPRDLTLTSALNTDYLLTLPIYIDWKKASVSSVIIFR